MSRRRALDPGSATSKPWPSLTATCMGPDPRACVARQVRGYDRDVAKEGRRVSGFRPPTPAGPCADKALAVPRSDAWLGTSPQCQQSTTLILS